MKRCKKKIVSVFLICICLLCQAGCSDSGKTDSSQNKMLTKAQVQEDSKQVIETLEEVHPVFLLEGESEAYKTAKKNYIKATAKKMTLYEFQEATSIYLSSINDGHTGIQWGIYDKNPILQLEECYQDGKTYLCENGEKTAIWVKEIGGVDIEKIYQKIDLLRGKENQSAEIENRETFILLKNVLKSCGVKVKNEKTEVLFSDGSKENYTFGRIKKDIDESEENSWHMDGDIFVVDFKSCEVDTKLDFIVLELEKAISNGCTKVIIDARGNQGGNSNACEKLLRAMEMYPPGYSEILTRFSSQAAEQRGYTKKDGIYKEKSSEKGRKENEAVNLAVLSDRNTFSSANMLCIWVQDGKLGKIIGEGSSNNPNSYGDILTFTLKNSELGMSVSHRRYIRPDRTRKENMLIPDIEIPAADAYDKAVEYLNTVE